MKRNFMNSRWRLLKKAAADTTSAGEAFDVHAWLNANCSWAGYEQARLQQRDPGRASLSQTEVNECTAAMLGAYLATFHGWRRYNPWFFTTVAAGYSIKLTSEQAAMVQKFMTSLGTGLTVIKHTFSRSVVVFFWIGPAVTTSLETPAATATASSAVPHVGRFSLGSVHICCVVAMCNFQQNA